MSIKSSSKSLEDCTEAIIDYRGKTPPKTTFGIPLITAKVVKAGRIEKTREYIAEADYDSWMRRGMPKEGDVVITTEAPLGEVAQLGAGKLALAQRLIALRGKSGVLDNTFLKYFLMSREMQDQLKARASGTTVLGIKQSELRKLTLELPPFDEQVSTGRILGTLDDKIELNRRMCATLEATARALFKSWFVDFDPVRAKAAGKKTGLPKEIEKLFPAEFEDSELGEVPKGWKIRNADEEFNITMGQSPPGETYNELRSGVPFYQGSTDFGFRFPLKRIYCTAPTRLASRNDTLISVRAPVGDINMAIEDCAIGRGLAAARHKSGSIPYTFYFMGSLKDDFDKFEAGGTVFGSMSKKDFHGVRRAAPPSEVVKVFDQIVAPIDGKVTLAEEATRALVGTRDTLLPKLISGKLDVSAS